MIKITNKEYFLPTIDALTRIERMSSGATQPLLLRGVCTKTGLKNDYVTKFRSSARMSNEASARELIAAFIAMQLGLQVAEPVLINITPEFTDTLVNKNEHRVASDSSGLNFGCRYLAGYREFIIGQKLNDNQYEVAQNIYAFDVFISNPDRRIDKQNMLTDGNNVLIFDHELAFSFIMAITKSPSPWLISPADLNWIKNHFFYNILKEFKPNFANFVENLSGLNSDFWAKLTDLIPNAWTTYQIGQIQTNLQSIVENRKYFLEQLNLSLL
jgi:hypothetical protein